MNMAERPKEVFFDTLCPDCQPEESTEEALRGQNKLFVLHEETGIVQPSVLPAQAPAQSPQSEALMTQKQKKKIPKQAKKETPGRKPIGSPVIDKAETRENDRDTPALTPDQVGSPAAEGAKVEDVEKNAPAPGEIESSVVGKAKPKAETIKYIPAKKREPKNEGRSSTDSDWVKVPEDHDEPWVFVDVPEDSSEEELLTTTGWPKNKPSGIKGWFGWK